MTKAEFDARYSIRPTPRGFGLWDNTEQRFIRHDIDRRTVEQRRAWLRQNCEG